uniref:Uncharacterized protein n=1 Tax=Spongospora subterranea TaxID=70186 RepID=A0A0H5QY51_9EUKA|eukprot:CRZ06657.1 hypothetical protein [Spongospora subterranea]
MMCVCVFRALASQLYIYINLHIESVTRKMERFCLVQSSEDFIPRKNYQALVINALAPQHAGYCSLLLLRSDTNHRENVIFRPPPVESLQKNGQDVARYKNVNQQRVRSHPFQYCGPVSIAPHINL